MSADTQRVALITDSTCDIPLAMREQYRIYVAALYVIWGSEQLRDGVDIDAETFYRRLATDPVHPTTSQPTPKDFVDIIEQARRDGAEEAVIITLSDRLSGTLDSAKQAASMVDMPVTCYDSRSISMGLGWQVIAAARAREAGADAAEMVAAADRARRHTAVLFTVDTLEYLHRGGRIGAAAKLLASALQIKPQLIIDPQVGIVEAGERVRTRKKALEAVYDGFFRRMDISKPMHLTVMHVNAYEEASLLEQRIRKEYPAAELFVTTTSPVIGVHGGPGTVGITGYYEG